MPINYLHNHKDFPALLRIIEEETGIVAGLVEKDYWIMHVLYGLQQHGFVFELKGGTSLSKGYLIINRFSEDIDIHINPPEKFGINPNPKNSKEKNIAAKKDFYDWLAQEIHIDGIVSVERDPAFDTKNYNSGGIRLYYNNASNKVTGVKEGILLEAGFATVRPNSALTISSWAYERAKQSKLEIIDNRAIDVVCYRPEYTLIEKLQTIATKYRQEKEGKGDRPNFMRQYYDVYCLLANEDVLKFIGTDEYHAYKKKHFPSADYEIPVSENEAFLLTDSEIRNDFKKRYEETAALYYNGQPSFDDLLERINQYIKNL